jgi:hypothetical protein
VARRTAVEGGVGTPMTMELMLLRPRPVVDDAATVGWVDTTLWFLKTWWGYHAVKQQMAPAHRHRCRCCDETLTLPWRGLDLRLLKSFVVVWSQQWGTWCVAFFLNEYKMMIIFKVREPAREMAKK